VGFEPQTAFIIIFIIESCGTKKGQNNYFIKSSSSDYLIIRQ